MSEPARSTDVASDELKPCPFCGGDAAIENTVSDAVAICLSCRAKIIRRHNAMDNDAIVYVTEAWNARISRAPITEAVAWQAVPKEPTAEMQDAFMAELGRQGVVMEEDSGYIFPTKLYRAMLDAALSHPLPQGEAPAWTDEQAFELARRMCVAHGGDPDAPIYQGHGQVGENWQVYLPMATEALIFCYGVKP